MVRFAIEIVRILMNRMSMDSGLVKNFIEQEVRMNFKLRGSRSGIHFHLSMLVSARNEIGIRFDRTQGDYRRLEPCVPTQGIRQLNAGIPMKLISMNEQASVKNNEDVKLVQILRGMSTETFADQFFGFG